MLKPVILVDFDNLIKGLDKIMMELQTVFIKMITW